MSLHEIAENLDFSDDSETPNDDDEANDSENLDTSIDTLGRAIAKNVDTFQIKKNTLEIPYLHFA